MVNVGQRFDNFVVVSVGERRADHKELKSVLIKCGVKSKKAREKYHTILCRCYNGTVTPDELVKTNWLIRNGINLHELIPLQYRRNWIDQPD